MRCAFSAGATLLVALMILLFVPELEAQNSGFDKAVAGATLVDGYFPLYIDAAKDKLYLKVDKSRQEFLYVTYLSSGVGSNDLGLDRGQIRSQQVVVFQRFGNKVLLVQPNEQFLAESSNAAEVKAVREAFAFSTLWGFELVAESPDALLIDASDFLLRADDNLARGLQRNDEGSFSVDKSRSVIDFDNCRSFPQNTEIGVYLTYVGGPAGRYLRSVAPNANAFTVGIRHSFVQLPPAGFEMRPADPRIGYFTLENFNYAAAYDQSMRRHFLIRHRLEKRTPGSAASEAREPIVYYLDPGTPEPVRSALLDGARWWNAAFEAAGYIDAFRVEMLPQDADMLDVRYNVIQWVHRATRGWSYGSSVVDPRTGEIIKGHVTLGSLRFRHDYNIAEALLQPYGAADSEGALAEVREMAIARLRQLSAHEVGHTLGLLHNFAASAYPDGLASVMDYPHPRVTLMPDSGISLRDAYPVGIGPWDKLAIRYGYADFGAGGADAAVLGKFVTDNLDADMLYISDSDARDPGGAHPYAHLWDNGRDAARQLLDVLAIRRLAITRFSERAIPPGTPLSELEDHFAPIYFFHRYQVEACSKIIGGVNYAYKVRGDRAPEMRRVDAASQRAALDAMLRSLSVADLMIPDRVAQLLVPPAPYFDGSREAFEGFTDPMFDPLAAAGSAAAMSFEFLLQPQRAARLIEQQAADPDQLSYREVLESTVESCFRSGRQNDMHSAVRRVVENAFVARAVELVRDADAAAEVRAQTLHLLQSLPQRLRARENVIDTPEEQAHSAMLTKQIELVDDSIELVAPSHSHDVPPGSPIGVDLHIGCDCRTARP